jgi:membrane-associated HD superfamily phosphohydrolase
VYEKKNILVTMNTYSRISIASFISSLLLAVIFFIAIIYAYLNRFDFPQAFSNKAVFIVVALFIAYIFVSIAVLSVHIALLVKNEQPKWMTVTGIILQVITLIVLASIAMWSKSIPTEISDITVFEYGQYHTTTTDSIFTGDGIQRKINLLSDINLIKKTDTISASLGISFGFRYTVYGFPPSRAVQMRIVNIYPSAGLRNPETKEVSTMFSRTSTVRIGNPLYTGYTFDYPWEIVPGEWTWQLWIDEKMLAKKNIYCS